MPHVYYTKDKKGKKAMNVFTGEMITDNINRTIELSNDLADMMDEYELAKERGGNEVDVLLAREHFEETVEKLREYNTRRDLLNLAAASGHWLSDRIENMNGMLPDREEVNRATMSRIVKAQEAGIIDREAELFTEDSHTKAVEAIKENERQMDRLYFALAKIEADFSQAQKFEGQRAEWNALKSEDIVSTVAKLKEYGIRYDKAVLACKEDARLKEHTRRRPDIKIINWKTMARVAVAWAGTPISTSRDEEMGDLAKNVDGRMLADMFGEVGVGKKMHEYMYNENEVGRIAELFKRRILFTARVMESNKETRNEVAREYPILFINVLQMRDRIERRPEPDMAVDQKSEIAIKSALLDYQRIMDRTAPEESGAMKNVLTGMRAVVANVIEAGERARKKCTESFERLTPNDIERIASKTREQNNNAEKKETHKSTVR